MGDGRQSGTSGSPSILNVSPEAAVGGGLALLRTGDRIRIDLNTRRVDVLLPDAELAARRAAWAPPELVNKTPWEEIYRGTVGQLGHRRLPGAGDALSERAGNPRREPQQPLTKPLSSPPPLEGGGGGRGEHTGAGAGPPPPSRGGGEDSAWIE